jgi:hypothetical protein
MRVVKALMRRGRYGMEPQQLCAVLAEGRASTPQTHPGNGSEKSKSVQKPQDHGNDHDGIQDPFDSSLHWDVAINQPKENANYDQDYHKLN